MTNLDRYLGLSGRVAVVTGAVGGIGAEIVSRFVEAGMKVAAVDVVPTDVAMNKLPLLTEGDHVVLNRDVSAVASCDALIEEVVNRYSRVDVLVNCAAILRRISVDDASEELWDQLMSANLKSQFFLSRAVSRPMRAQRWGRIINFSSQGAYTGGYHSSSIYNISKGGVLTATRSFARLLAPYGICVNAIAPGGVRTPMMELSDEQLKEFISTIPLGRMAEPREIADIVLFMASEASRYITGTTIDASGGQLMH